MNINIESLVIFLTALVIGTGVGLGIGLEHSKDSNCTVTITDMRGVQHVITGMADE